MDYVIVESSLTQIVLSVKITICTAQRILHLLSQYTKDFFMQQQGRHDQ